MARSPRDHKEDYQETSRSANNGAIKWMINESWVLIEKMRKNKKGDSNDENRGNKIQNENTNCGKEVTKV